MCDGYLWIEEGKKDRKSKREKELISPREREGTATVIVYIYDNRIIVLFQSIDSI